MNVADMLKQTGALDSISRELGINHQQAQTGANALLPALLGGFKKQAQMEAGAGPAAGPVGGGPVSGGPVGGGPVGGGGLLGLLGGLGGGGLLDAVTSQHPTPREPGNAILGQVFGSKDVSRTVAGQAAQNTGMDPSVLKKMLPLLAMAVSGYLASRSSAGQPGGTAQQSGAGGPGSSGGGFLKQMLGGGHGAGDQHTGGQATGGLSGLLSGLDMDRDGNPLDDILHMVSKFRR